nr:ribosomal protein S4 [Thismia panamensis]
MSTFRESRLKKIKYLGTLPGFSRKKIKLLKLKKKKSKYRISLEEKQKLSFNYGLSERQLLRYIHTAEIIYKKVKYKKTPLGKVISKLLEMRFDSILFRLGLYTTIIEARQMINHRHFLVNKRIVNRASFFFKGENFLSRNENKYIYIVNKL